MWLGLVVVVCEVNSSIRLGAMASIVGVSVVLELPGSFVGPRGCAGCGIELVEAPRGSGKVGSDVKSDTADQGDVSMSCGVGSCT